MDTVVIIDDSKKMIENYIRMLEACKEEMNFKYFKYPEKAVEYIRKEGAAVVVCELDMPVMSGKEVFEMIDMISPETVKIAMTQVKDIKETLEIVNHSRIFKVILKPFFFPEDLLEPIKSAINYYKLLEKRKSKSLQTLTEVSAPSRANKRLVGEGEKKKQIYYDISKTMSGMINGNLQCGNIELSRGEKEVISKLMDGLFQEFMRYYMFGAQNYIFHINYLMNLFHAPDEHQVFRLKREHNQELPDEVLKKIAYTIFIVGYVAKEIYGQYQLKTVIDKKNEGFVLGLLLKIPGQKSAQTIFGKRVTEVVRQVTQKMIDILAKSSLQEVSENLIAEKIYY